MPIVRSRCRSRPLRGQLFARLRDVHHETRGALIPLTLLAAASGARTMSGVAAITPGRARSAARLAALSELIADKLPNIPDRVDPALLLGRVAAGAVVGALVANRTGRGRAGSVISGGLIAFASAHATYRMRRALRERLPALAAAVVEDAIVVGAAVAGAAMLRSMRPARVSRR
jgi:uncharacterized membrane protein